MPNYLFVLCLINIYRLCLLHSPVFFCCDSLVLFFGVFCWFVYMCSILFIWILQVGAIVCFKKLEMMFEFCAIICHINCMMRHLYYLPVCCSIVHMQHTDRHTQTGMHRHVGRVNRKCCSYCDDDRTATEHNFRFSFCSIFIACCCVLFVSHFVRCLR